MRKLRRGKSQRRRQSTCRCEAYAFPHRVGSGQCNCHIDYGINRDDLFPQRGNSPLHRLAECARGMPQNSFSRLAKQSAPIFRKHGLIVRVIRCRWVPTYLAIYGLVDSGWFSVYERAAAASQDCVIHFGEAPFFACAAFGTYELQRYVSENFFPYSVYRVEFRPTEF